MCGIAGIFDLTGYSTIDRSLLEAMNQTQFHRGPDEGGIHIEPGVGLAHRRLSIIDLSSGQQPMATVDGNVTLVYNGEIYNFPDLTEELRAKGYQFRTHCDTEVILYAWQEWGESCVDHFRGMFAFVLYDRDKEVLFCARDRLGIKPFYYSVLADGSFIFGSELKVLHEHPGLSKKVCYEAIEDYFALGYIPEPKSIYRDVFKLRPGHSLLLEKGKTVPEQKEYWDVPFQVSGVIDEGAMHEELVERMRKAVDIRMVAEVPLGAFLSGGVDSSAVVAMMAQNSDKPVNTCAIGFDVKQYNETEFATMVAEQYKTNHHENIVSSDDFDLLDTLARVYDEPYADSSAIPTYRVCELAKKEVTVVLSGDGGDESFAGYRRHRWHMNEEKIRSLFPLGFRRAVFGTLAKIYPKADWAPRIFRAKSTFESLSRDPLSAYLHTVSITTDSQRHDLFNKEMHGKLKGYRAVEVFKQYADRRRDIKNPLSQIQYIDLKTYLPGDILTKVDRASMAHALEVRVPLLDHKFVEWVSNLPPDQKLKGQEGKYALKKSLEPHLPNDVLYRDKMGFGVPLAKWFRGPLKDRVTGLVNSGTLVDSGIFDQAYLKQIVDQHMSGMKEHSAVIWALLMFDASTRHLDLEF